MVLPGVLPGGRGRVSHVGGDLLEVVRGDGGGVAGEGAEGEGFGDG